MILLQFILIFCVFLLRQAAICHMTKRSESIYAQDVLSSLSFDILCHQKSYLVALLNANQFPKTKALNVIAIQNAHPLNTINVTFGRQPSILFRETNPNIG